MSNELKVTVQTSCHSELAKNLFIPGKIFYFIQDDNMKKWLTGLVLAILLSSLLTAAGYCQPAFAMEDYADAAFYRVWQRTDKPIQEGRTDRSWLWGPSPFTLGLKEDYQESPEGKRLVQYFDKSRMEINNPGGKTDDPFYVTNGLLVNELMSGRLQLGNNRFEQRLPSERGVAGDDNDTNGPTYAVLGKLNIRTTANNSPIQTTVNHTGQIGSSVNFPDYSVKNAYFVSETGHNIPNVFWDFLNTTGVIYDRVDNPDLARLFDPVFYATGYPVTEAYWAKVKVAGKVQDVLLQAFERQILTYTPANPNGYQVEMGNVGRHYYQWRYANKKPLAISQFGEIPKGLKSHFMVGLGNQQDNVAWMTKSGASWDARYQYLVGDALKDSWTGWHSPEGSFASDYMNGSDRAGYLPIFTYYVLQYCSPNVNNKGLSEGDKDLANLNNAETMRAYYANFKLLLDKAGAFGKTVIIHLEPDMWAFAQSKLSKNSNRDATQIPAKVAGSGYGDRLAELPDNLAGFAQALVALRDKYAPNALLALHVNSWGDGADIATATDPYLDVTSAANNTVQFIKSLKANFDMLFFDLGDRDAAYKQEKYHPNSKFQFWWDLNNIKYPNFERFRKYMGNITRGVGLRAMLWQVPEGNTLYRSQNNKPGHYQDNRVQYFLGDNYRAILSDWIEAGLIGILFGAGAAEQTTNEDAIKDGLTNPPPINGNNLVSQFPDDDGGYLRLRGQNYFKNGALPLS